ncbi:MAG: hypothetical protein JNL98_02445 [Bryobacterales bacterium]|nr:hypothetical protein [Bryobacterales bacterium]
MPTPRWLLLVLLAVSLFAADSNPPITRDALEETLRTRKASAPELVHFVKLRGVDFRLTPEIEQQLRKVGAHPDLLMAIKSNYRGAGVLPKSLAPASPASSRSVASKPLTKAEVVTLLQVETPGNRIVDLAKQRGLGFRITPDVTDELKAAGADTKLLAALVKYTPGGTPTVNANKGRVFQRAFQDPAGQLGGATNVRFVYIEPASDGFDALLRAEIEKQMSAMAVVDSKQDADAVFTRSGVVLDASGSKVLWSNQGLVSDVAAEAASQLVSRWKQSNP